MPLPPSPPAQLLEGVGPAGRRAGGACHTEQPLHRGHMRVRGPGWAGPSRRREHSHLGEKACPPGRGRWGEAEMEAKERRGTGRRRFLPAEEGRGPPLGQIPVGRERKGRGMRLRPSPPEGAQALTPTATHHSSQTPDTPVTQHPTDGRGEASMGSLPTSILSISGTTARAPGHSRDSAPNPDHRSASPLHTDRRA